MESFVEYIKIWVDSRGLRHTTKSIESIDSGIKMLEDTLATMKSVRDNG
jgi:hypothetical protein